ncbi:N-acetylmuramoyl-L-alanine amidase [Pseudonocardia humida]|uniref:N-acetylmuramoyl-L-alanine amidase n=1 Tax=Pseudonocardia humida TaxID=2800819 RepID=A0ABT1ADH2_9PSEU|nr:N-acetylmuramoyl-L-alanine amidase [Pseudonocardia humida]MCO1661087.1 N-acetylmuramoyl-L-alanine amidase [Pseudonocardia humida]
MLSARPTPPTRRAVVGWVLCAAPLAAACTAPPTPPAPVVTPAAAVVAPTAAPRPPVVVLDAGHNGGNAAHAAEIRRQVPDGRGGTKDCNTTGTATDAGYPEHAFTFDVVERATQRLTAAGVRVVLVRTDDTGVGPCVDERGRAGEAADADAVVAVHADGSAPDDSGFHVALPDPPLHPAQGAPSQALGAALRDALRAGGFPDSDYLGHEGLAPRADLAGLNHSTRPVALVECANMRNPDEAALVSSPEGRQRYADAIATGVLSYLSTT